MKKNELSEEVYKLSLEQLKNSVGQPLDGAAEYSPEMSSEKLEALLNLSSGGASASDKELYTYYRDLYRDAADAAAKNAFGIAASNTGGYASTYAVSEAREAYDKYMRELYSDYEQARAQRSKTAASAAENAVSFAEKAAKYGDYSYYEALGADMSGAKKSDAFDAAVDAAKYGDYSLLETLGYDTRLLRYSELLDIAEAMAKYGDYSGMEALGVDMSSAKEKEKLEKAVTLAKYGDYSLLKELYAGFKEKQSKISVSIQNGAEKAYLNGGYKQLSAFLDRQIGYGQISADDKQRIISAVTG